MAKEEEIGKVIHYYDKIMVAVVELRQDLSVGGTIRFSRGDEAFEQKVKSMQVEHEPVEKAKKGTEVAIKVEQAVKRNWKVYK